MMRRWGFPDMHGSASFRIFILLLFTYVGWTGAAAEHAPVSETWFQGARHHLHNWLNVGTFPPDIWVSGEPIQVSVLVQRFYEARNYQTAWSDEQGPKVQAYHLVQTLQAADREGLRPDDYHLTRIVNIMSGVKNGRQGDQDAVRALQLAVLDILATDAFLTYAVHAAHGRLPVAWTNLSDANKNQDDNFPSLLESALAGNRVEETLRSLLPVQAGYLNLRRVLDRYRDIADAGLWPAQGAFVALHPGQRDPVRMKIIRGKLRAVGDLPPAGKAGPDESLFDPTLSDGLKRFQSRHGLKATGELDAQTWDLLNQPMEKYIRCLEINLERWRWLPRSWGERYLLVNIPAFQLEAREGERAVLSLRTVVGQQYRRTPMLSSTLTHIILNPKWEIPRKIWIRDKYPHLRKHPEYFQEHHIVVIKGWGKNARPVDPQAIPWDRVSPEELYDTYRFWQAPGVDNPLGRIKFMFPNPFNIYLHDTSSPELFDQDVRSFSSGCIRIEKPIELAVYLCRGTFWTRERLEAALKTDIEQRLDLKRTIPVHIVYWTAWVDPDGRLQWRPDIYGRDQALEDSLQGKFEFLQNDEWMKSSLK